MPRFAIGLKETTWIVGRGDIAFLLLGALNDLYVLIVGEAKFYHWLVCACTRVYVMCHDILYFLKMQND